MSKTNKGLVEELQQLNGFTDSFIESLKDGFILIDTKGSIIITNAVFCDIIGYAKDEILGLHAPFPFWPKEFHNDYTNRFDEMLKDNLKCEFEAIYVQKNKDRIPVLLFVATVKNKNNNAIAYLVLVQDLTNKKHTLDNKSFPNKELYSVLNYRKGYLDLIVNKHLTSQLDNALDYMSDGLVSFDTKWCYTYVNKRAGELIGRDPSSLIGKHVWTEFPEAVGHSSYNAFHKAVETQETQIFDDFYAPFNIWFENRVYPFPKGLTLYFTDITKRKKIENLLIESEKNLDNIINNIADPVFVKDDKSRLIFVNDAFCEVFNHSKKDIIGKTLEDDVAPEERTNFFKIDKEVLKTGIESINIENLTLNGSETKIISTKKNRFIDANGNKFIVGIIRDITQLKKIERELKSANDYSENLINSMHDGLVVYDTDTVIISVNNSFCIMSGFSANELIGQHYPYSFCPPEIIAESSIRHKKAAKGFKLENFESVYMRKDGKRFNVNVMVSYIDDSEGNMLAYFGTVQDITNRKQFEIQLLESEYNLRQSQIVGNIGSYTVEFDTMTWEASDVLNKIFGINKSYKKTVESWNNLIHVDEKEDMLTYLKTCIQNKLRFDKEYRILKHDTKKEIWVHGIGEFIFDEDANPIKMIGTIQDITERKQTEIELQKNEKSLLEAQKIAKTGNYNLNLKTGIAETSIAFNEIAELDLNSEVTLDLWTTSITHTEDAPILLKMLDKCVETSEKFDLEFRILTKKNKNLKWIHGLGEVLYKDGQASNFFGTIQDITHRKKAELKLRSSKEFTDNLVMSMQEGLIIVNLVGEIIMVNESACHILGYSREELLDMKRPFPFENKKDVKTIEKKLKSPQKGRQQSIKFELIKKNGKVFTASFLTGIINNDAGELIATYATMKDISEEEKAKSVLENIAQKSLERKQVIIELASLVGTDYKVALNKITALSAKTLNVERASVLKFNKEKTEMCCKKQYNLKNDVYENGQVYSKKGNEKFFNTLIENKIVAASNALSHELSKGFIDDYLIPLNIKSKLSIPIQGINEVYGILCFEQVRTVHVWTTDEEEFATSIANLVSLMIQSNERELAEKASILANQQLTLANEELNKLQYQLEQENVYLRNELDLVFNYEEMVYGSVEFSNVLNEVEKVAPTNATVLLTGESGTGKELLARAIHNISHRNKKPLIKVNCSAIPRELIESELFGHKKGSFTGAFSDKVGKFELADGGTLFLDEIGELPLDMQPKILRFLQEGEIEVVGGLGSKTLDVRVIAATNRNLLEEIKKKQFREDLYFRLHVFPINVPALRERKDDIPLLVEHFVDKFNKAYDKHIKYISDDAMSKLKAYNWPGNIRELENLIERASILSHSETLVVPGFETAHQKTKQLITGKDLSLDSVLRNHILEVLENCQWKISGKKSASELLGLKPSTLRDKMKKLGIHKSKVM
ncbi:PAS domain S-box protein [Psychroserpens ponticola]|uniref:PAS domain S-box protein n=1 Tax=Psychroserpens ponticola TaxID=2932268 RepID=A0ABY7S2A4_9FLAO|nr:PAS domain S-box protein [Psychroserpens ponticola]WCO03412.1 PAS domain S-box protein [Psychroserpens ponticola]